MGLLTHISDSSPMYTHNYSEFMETQNENTMINFPKLCFQQKIGRVEYVVKNILDDYMYELETLANTYELNDDEVKKYRYKPKLMSADVYNTTEFYFLILRLNNMRGPHEFVNIDKIKLIQKSTLIKALAAIYNAESSALSIYNKRYM